MIHSSSFYPPGRDGVKGNGEREEESLRNGFYQDVGSREEKKREENRAEWWCGFLLLNSLNKEQVTFLSFLILILILIVGLFYLFAVVAFDGNSGDVLPSKLAHHFHNGLRLKVVRWYDAAKVLESRFVRQFGARRRVAYLRDLFVNKKKNDNKKTSLCSLLLAIGKRFIKHQLVSGVGSTAGVGHHKLAELVPRRAINDLLAGPLNPAGSHTTFSLVPFFLLLLLLLLLLFLLVLDLILL